jgi:hypothetical protein
MQQRNKKQKIEDQTPYLEEINSFKKIQSKEQSLREKIESFQLELKKCEEEKMKKYENICEHGWYVELCWHFPKATFTQFQPFTTQKDAENAVQKVLNIYNDVTSEYVRRFSLYIEKLCPDIDPNILQSFIADFTYTKSTIKLFRKLCERMDISELLRYIEKHDDFPDSQYSGNGKTTLKLKQDLNFLRKPFFKISKYEIPSISIYNFHLDYNIKIDRFREFPLNNPWSLFPNALYAQNLFETATIRKMRYLILLAQKHDKLSLFGKLPREIIHYICSFMYYGEMPI